MNIFEIFIIKFSCWDLVLHLCSEGLDLVSFGTFERRGDIYVNLRVWNTTTGCTFWLGWALCSLALWCAFLRVAESTCVCWTLSKQVRLGRFVSTLDEAASFLDLVVGLSAKLDGSLVLHIADVLVQSQWHIVFLLQRWRIWSMTRWNIWKALEMSGVSMLGISTSPNPPVGLDVVLVP